MFNSRVSSVVIATASDYVVPKSIKEMVITSYMDSTVAILRIQYLYKPQNTIM